MREREMEESEEGKGEIEGRKREGGGQGREGREVDKSGLCVGLLGVIIVHLHVVTADHM